MITYTLTLEYTAGQLRMTKHRCINSKLKEILNERDYLLGLMDVDFNTTRPCDYVVLRPYTVDIITKLTNKVKKITSNDNELQLRILTPMI